MNTLKLSTYITILFTLLFLSSCGGGGGASSSSATGGQYNATVVGSTCEITLSNGATHTVTTDDTGIASFSGFTVPAGLTTMECGGGNYTSEYDESGKIAPTQRAATNYSGSGELTLIVTPLSNIAYNIASNTGNLAAAIDQINADVATTFGLSADFISTIPKDLNDGAITGATQADKLGIILANLSVLDGATAGSATQHVDSATELTNLATSVAGVTANDFNRTDNNANNSTTTVNTSTATAASAPTISGDSSVLVGSSITLNATGGTTNTIWISADTNIATVSDSGVVTGAAVGTVVITAMNLDLAGNFATVTITVNAVTYDVTYNANNATSGSTPTAQSKTYGTDLTLATNSNNLARTGYTFAGWNTKADGSGTNYATGATYSTNEALTLYAQWTIITYDVTYNANNATSGSTPTAQSKTYGTDLTLATNSNNLARTGYTFAGWNTKADGSGTNYATGATYSTNEALTLYAQWAPVITYDVTYNANGATSGTTPTAQSKTHGSDLPLATNTGNLARTGHTFAGWNTEADGSGTDYAAGATYSTNAALTLYAQWAPVITYDVTYNANGATSGTTPTAQSKTHGSDLPLATNTGNLARTGHTFAGWNTEADGSGTDYAAGATYSTNAALTLYAQWAPVITYDVTYNANGATSGTTPTAQSKTHGSDLPLATNTGNLARTGHTFAGWNTEADGSGIDYAVGATYSTDKALTLYAKWTAITYDVTYNANGATSGTTPTAQSKTHGSDLPLATNTGNLARTGHTFAGWNTEADGSGIDYAVGATYSTNAALTLYAQWAPVITYDVTYNANGATSGTTPTAQSKTHGSDLPLATNTGNLARTGHTFAGWNTEADGSGTDYAAGATYSTNAALTLYAQWAPVITYDVTYNANGATSGTTPTAQSKTHGSDLPLATNTGNLARTGHTFAGWNTEADGSGTDYAVGATYSTNAALTLYAQWAPNSVTMNDPIAGYGEISLSWSSSGSGATYNLYYAKESFANLGDISNYATLNGGTLLNSIATPHKTINLTNGITYYFVVTAIQNNIESSASNEVSATPQGKLNDTGITWGGDYSSGNNSDCTGENISAQDCSHGRDAKAQAGTLQKVGAGHAGFDFTKISSSGAELPASSTSWSCVRDNHTGLLWEVKTDDGGIHDKDNTYRWGGLTALGRDHSSKKGTYYDDWNMLVNDANAGSGLCGFTDWRVPTKEELRSIVDYSRTNLTIDTTYFPNTPNAGFWSSSPNAFSSSDAWLLDFSSGYDNNNFRSDSYRVRLVRLGE